ncbi:hypothetical protein D3C86_1964580 [compost metagenome]
MKVVLEAGSELTFKAAGSFIKLDGGGITLVGPTIKFNSGGGPGSGSGAAPVLPGKVKAADADVPGVPLEALAKQSVVFRQASKGVCEVCEAAKDAEDAK